MTSTWLEGEGGSKLVTKKTIEGEDYPQKVISPGKKNMS